MHSEEFLHSLMRKQLKLSITCALAFLLVLFGLPVANYVAPELMAKRVFGFTLTWLPGSFWELVFSRRYGSSPTPLSNGQLRWRRPRSVRFKGTPREGRSDACGRQVN